MSGKKKKTILRTIRLSEEIDELLEKDAQEQNISANALISKIMIRYVEWDRIAKKLDLVTIAKGSLKALINEVSDEKLEEIGRDHAIRKVKDHAMWEFGKTDFDTLLKTDFLISKYGAFYSLSVENRIEGNCVITLHHDLGRKGVIYFRSYYDSLIRNELKTQPTIKVTDDVITISFHQLSKPRL